MPLAFPASYFPSTATFHGPSTALPLTGGTPITARVGPAPTNATRVETHLQPEGAQVWYVETPTNPGAGVDWLVGWNSRTFRVTAASVQDDTFTLWRTQCVEVS